MNTDLLLIAVPMRPLTYPPMSLPLLKSVLHRHGHRVALSDANLEYHKHCGRPDEDQFLRDTMAMQNTESRTWEQLEGTEFGQWIRGYTQRLLDQHRPRVVGLSVFTFLSALAAYYMARVIREQAPAGTRLIVGGFGASSPLRFSEALGAPKAENLAQTLLSEGTIDTAILGDGEEALVQFMRTLDNDDPQRINRINGFDGMPYPDYSDMDLAGYSYTNNLTLPVTGSKGCVRRCTFCDVPVMFGKYQQRSGRDIAMECIHLYETYGAKTLYLTDSLTNGSMKSFMEFIQTLAEERTKKNYSDLQWTGQYITRPAHQIPHDRDYYPLMAASGATSVSVGCESGSDRVLEHMDKKMKISDLFTELEHFRKHGISMTVNILPSYPTETREDFEQTIKMISDFQPYMADGTMEKIAGIARWYTHDNLNRWDSLGPDHGWHVNRDDGNMWWYEHNPELTLQERVFRRLAIGKCVAELKIPVAMDENYEARRTIKWYEGAKDDYARWLSTIGRHNAES